MNKREIISSFVNGATSGTASNLKIDGNKLINYRTIISFRIDDGKIILNNTKYSPTTSRNQNLLRYYGQVVAEMGQKEFYEQFIYNN